MLSITTDGPVIKRHLAAVVFADVVGYSRRVGENDVDTMVEWKALREGLLEPRITAHSGKLLQVLGDGLLIEFQSVVDAVRWSDEVQRAIAQAREEKPEALQLRIGINVEDVIEDGGNIFGDGVNIAARIQQLANAGEIVMTATVRDHIWNKLGVELSDMGERVLKNIAQPIRLYRLEGRHDAGRARRFAHPHLTWNNRPSIAVLPFKNLGGNPEDEYFGEGITEDIIAALAVNRALLVIARHSTLPYRSRQSDVRQIASELGVRYILDGSVRHQGKALRIAVQLIDADKSHAIWSHRYDGSTDDLFAFQDEIAASVSAQIGTQLHEAESARVRTKPTDSLDAYDCILRAFPLFYSANESEFMAAGDLLERAVNLDPMYAQAMAHKAWWYVLLFGEWRTKAAPADAERAVAAAQLALKLDPADSFVIAVAAHVESFLSGQPEAAAEMFDRALQINKNSAFAWGLSAITCCYLGRPEEALDRVRNALRLSPFDPMKAFFLGVAGFAEFVAGRYEEALGWLIRARRENPGHLACHRNLAACYAQLGRIDDAKAAAADLMAREPGFRIGEFARRYPLKSSAALDRLLSGLRTAGLQE